MQRPARRDSSQFARGRSDHSPRRTGPEQPPSAGSAAAGFGAALMLFACEPYWVCEASFARYAELPQHLSDTGLYADVQSGELAPGVRPYTPQFSLWTDGAEKRRWVYLPPGSRIDTTNMDDWSFPQGTKFWKEFSRDGVRAETRMFEKRGPGARDWQAIAYVWDAGGTEALAQPHGWSNVLGTPHDVPAAAECGACHGGRDSWILSFSAVQLSATVGEGELAIEQLVAEGLLSRDPSRPVEVPGNDVERNALGYLHANCGHCHNQAQPADKPCFAPDSPLDFWLRVDHMGSPAETPTYTSAVGYVIEPGEPDDSRLIAFVDSRGMFAQMPPIGTDQIDGAAVDRLRRWVKEMR